MKLFLPFIAFGAALLPLSSSAEVNLELGREVSPLVVNGEAMGLFISKKSNLSLNNGVNQVVVRVEKLVRPLDAEREKFNSQPVVVTFDSSDSTLELSLAKKIETTAQAEQFNNSPTFLLVNKSTGQAVPSTQELLPHGGGITRDYEKELVKYNRKRGIQLSSDFSAASTSVATNAGMPMAAAHTLNVSHDKVVVVPASTENQMILLQADFLRMNDENRKKFLSWAVENVR